MTADCMTFPERVSDGVLNALADIHLDNSEVHRMAVELRELRKQGENIALLAVTKACCEALGKQVQPAFIADEIAELRKRLADAALVEQELREELAAMKAPK